MEMLNQKEFDTLVAAQMGLTAATVRTYLHLKGFKAAERKVEGMYNRPYYNREQIAEAVTLLKNKEMPRG